MLIRLLMTSALSLILGACAHPISINPADSSTRADNPISAKKVAYVMTDADRGKQVTTEGGGGDKVSYYPYKDLEKSIRDVLSSLYSEVMVINSSSDFPEIQKNNISFVYAPEISTSSNSDSMFTWPPTRFTIEYASNVTDPAGNLVSRVRVVGSGNAEFSEFKNDFGLAGRRAASDLKDKLRQEIVNNPRLH